MCRRWLRFLKWVSHKHLSTCKDAQAQPAPVRGTHICAVSAHDVLQGHHAPLAQRECNALSGPAYSRPAARYIQGSARSRRLWSLLTKGKVRRLTHLLPHYPNSDWLCRRSQQLRCSRCKQEWLESKRGQLVYIYLVHICVHIISRI